MYSICQFPFNIYIYCATILCERSESAVNNPLEKKIMLKIFGALLEVFALRITIVSILGQLFKAENHEFTSGAFTMQYN